MRYPDPHRAPHTQPHADGHNGAGGARTVQGPPTQPDPRQVLSGTLWLCVVGSPVTYNVTSDASGFFTLTTSLPTGTYGWRFKGSRWLAPAGTLTLSGGAGVSHAEL